MTDEDAFLYEILAHRDDDTPRLIYADWLEERGDPRAELIRVQCELAGLRHDGRSDAELAGRERTLLRQLDASLLAPLKRLGATSVEVRRGFVEAVRIKAADYLENADKLFQQAPILRSLNLRKSADLIPRIAASPHLEHVQTLDLRLAGLEPNHLKTLLASPYLTGLAELNLQGNHLAAGGARVLADSPVIGQLVHCNLAGNGLGADGVAALAETGGPLRLETLDLWGCHIGNRGLRILKSSRLLPGLKRLDLSFNDITPAALERFLSSPNLPQGITIVFRLYGAERSRYAHPRRSNANLEF